MPWTTVAGRVERYFDNDRLVLGRRKFWATKQGEDGPREEMSDTFSFYAAFVAHSSPWRLAMIGLDNNGRAVDGGDNNDWVAVIGWADQAWARLDGAMTPPEFGDAPARGRDAATHGDLCVRSLLKPSWLRDLLGVDCLDREFDLSGDVLLSEPELAGELAVMGSEVAKIVYDPELDIVRSFTNFVSGRVAHRVSLDNVTRL